MSDIPLPPFLPEDLESFRAHIQDHVEEWFLYCQKAYVSLDVLQTRINELEGKTAEYLAYQNTTQETLLNNDTRIKELLGVQKYQQSEIERLQRAALSVPTPAVRVNQPSRGSEAELSSATLDTTTQPVTPASSQSDRRSERLPDPAKFEGLKPDLRRFNAQIRAKMNANRDRFYTA